MKKIFSEFILEIMSLNPLNQVLVSYFMNYIMVVYDEKMS